MINFSSFTIRRTLFAATLGLLSASSALAQAPVAFTAGNFVVVRVGDGAAALSSAATATFLQEYTRTGTLVQTIALPTADAGTTLAFTETGSSTADASLSRSADGRYLILPGYNAAAGTAAVATTASATTNRLIGRIGADGVLNATTRISDAFSGTTGSGVNIRGAASANGSSFYAVGSAGGVVYTTFGNTGASTTLSTGSPTNLRSVNIFGGNLYVSSSSSPTFGVLQVGTGLPTAAGQTLALLNGFSTTTGPSSYGFFFTDQSAAVPGLDVVYVADDRATADGGIQKWSLVGTTWTLNGTIGGSTTAALRGLAGSVSGTTVTLVASGGGGLYAVTDNAGYNAAPSIAALPAAIATPGTNTAFRGVAPAPLATALAARTATAAELSLYPNPVQDMLTISLPTGSVAGHTAELRDLLGRSVRTAATLPPSGQLSLAGLAAGTYLLTLDGSLTQRISKTE
ncbi:T9SS type A sorting domain-containing protein [Hymenobacter sp. HMF4947]|uniref:T9SS type A sorting domain-containing protein n=1 Tax=Hymenobacter ginkgonis TaxID=2682976 RepID=A0A7K1T8T1_9BACT|nr:T9SS type A sorting domain-containing protein [Hymenobacter ginkgonis]MVN74808.1 T9SS type A sorting domain-containing protein [Hymenobacter ginkgonis]